MKITKMAVWVFLTTFAAGPSFASDECLDKNRITKILGEYRWKVQTSQKTYKKFDYKDLCDAKNSVEYRVFEAILFLEDLKENPTRKLDDLDSGMIKTSFIEYFKSKPKTIIFDSPQEEICEGSDTMGYADTRRGALHICPSAGKVSALKMAEVLVHESRHLDESGFEHVTCSQGVYKNTGHAACDSSFELGGAYAYTAEFFVRVSRALNVSDAVRAESRSLAYATYLYHFDKMPLGLKEGLFSQEENGRISFYDGTNVEPLFAVSPNHLMTLRFDSPTFYDAQKGQVKSYYTPGVVIDTQGAYANEYRETFNENKRLSLVDIYYFTSPDGMGLYSCRLFLTELVCMDSRSSMGAVISLSGITAKGFYLLQNKLAILDSNDELTILPTNFADLKKKKFSEFQKVKMPFDFATQVKWNQSYFGLTKDGSVQKMGLANKLLQPVQGFENLKIKKIIGPAFYSSKLNAL